MQLRRATHQDVREIESLVSSAYVRYVVRIGRKPKPMLADYGAAVSAHEIWLLEQGREVSAVLELIPYPACTLIENIAVRPDLQGLGLGRRLLLFAEEQAQLRGHGEVRLYTNAQFTENIAFYLNRGYRETLREGVSPSEVGHMSKTIA